MCALGSSTKQGAPNVVSPSRSPQSLPFIPWEADVRVASFLTVDHYFDPSPNGEYVMVSEDGAAAWPGSECWRINCLMRKGADGILVKVRITDKASLRAAWGAATLNAERPAAFPVLNCAGVSGAKGSDVANGACMIGLVIEEHDKEDAASVIVGALTTAGSGGLKDWHDAGKVDVGVLVFGDPARPGGDLGDEIGGKFQLNWNPSDNRFANRDYVATHDYATPEEHVLANVVVRQNIFNTFYDLFIFFL